MKKFVIIAVIVVLLILVLSLFCCSSPPIARRGDGEDFALTNISDFSRLSKYRYQSEKEDVWDFYSVEYNVTSLSITASGTTNWGKFTPDEITDVEEVKASGMMAHSQGVYYLRESSWGITSEYIYNMNNGVYAYSLSASSIVASMLEVELTDGWKIVYANNLSTNDEMYEVLSIIKHFYDREVLGLLDVEGAYTQDNGIYVLNKENTALVVPKLESCVDFTFWGRYLHSFTTWDIINYSATIDITDSLHPKTEYAVKVYFPSINKSIWYKGDLKYSMINNVKLDVPKEVFSAWQAYDTK